MVDIIAKELDYQTKISSEPSYSYTNIYPQSGGTQFSVANGGSDIIFELPPTSVYNLSRSYISMSVVLPASVVKDEYTWGWIDMYPYFRQIQLKTRGGLPLLDLNQAHFYSKMTLKYHKKLIDTMKGISIGTGTNTQIFEINSANNVLADATLNGGVRPNNSAPNKSYIENRYLIRGVVTANPPVQADSNITCTVNFYFKDFCDTILALDKNLYFNETLVLRCVFNDPSAMCFRGTAANNPTTGAAVMAEPVVFNNPLLRLAIENNLEIISGLMARVNSPEGLTLMIDYPWFYSVTQINAGSYSATLTINRTNGRFLEKIYYSAFTSGGTANLLYDNNNLNGVKFNRFYTNLNNKKTNDYDWEITATSLDDYNRMRESCNFNDNSYVGLNHYRYNWVWIEDFYDSCNDINDSTMVRGIDLNVGEQKWDLVLNSLAGNLTHTFFVILKRQLQISPVGITLD